MVCPHCGQEVTGAFCSQCGAPAPKPAGFQQFSAPPEKQANDHKAILWIFIIGAIVFGGLFLLGFLATLFSSLIPLLLEEGFGHYLSYL